MRPQRKRMLNGTNYDRDVRTKRLHKLGEEKRKQPGVEFPKAGDQKQLLIVRLDIASFTFQPSSSVQSTRDLSSVTSKDALCQRVQLGLLRLCKLFQDIDLGKRKISKLNKDGTIVNGTLNEFNFSATLGFGIGFFDKLSIPDSLRPRKLSSMPDHLGLGDIVPYSLPQTDLIIQLGSSSNVVNSWVYENSIQSPELVSNDSTVAADWNKNVCQSAEPPDSPDIVSAIEGWAIVTDLHAGFQRIDGRNLLGFNDGVSNPNPGSGDKFDEVVWNTDNDEGTILKDGTYMVFQKISHDLDQWRRLSSREQELWVGRNKLTGLLLGTKENEDQSFINALKNDDRRAKEKLRTLLHEQSDPERLWYDNDEFKNKVPAWSHVRKANPRQERILSGGKRLDRKLIFRRGYPFMEQGTNNRFTSGLLFISFQRDIVNSFEFIKKNWLNNTNFPTQGSRPFMVHEIKTRHSHGRFSTEELKKIKLNSSESRLLGLDDNQVFRQTMVEASSAEAQKTGKEGLAGPSELGATMPGKFSIIAPYGGGYYFIPPIPNKSIMNIGQQFFSKST